LLAAQVFKMKCVITAKSRKMKHKDIHNDLIFYLEGGLSPEREKEIRKHLEECSDCRNFAEVLKSSFSIIEKEKNPELTPFFYQAVKAKIENRKSRQTGFSIQRILQPALFIVLLVAGIGFGIMLGAEITGPSRTVAANSTDEMYYFDEMGSEPIESYFLN